VKAWKKKYSTGLARTIISLEFWIDRPALLIKGRDAVNDTTSGVIPPGLIVFRNRNRRRNLSSTIILPTQIVLDK
jgi:hypothetical protein